jgi:opacity protein-like surface antigen
MKKSLLAGICVLSLSSAAMAAHHNNHDDGLTLGVSASHMSDEDLSFNLVNFHAGYVFSIDDQFTLMPEVRVGTGVGDENVMGVNIELDRFVVLSVRANYAATSDLDLFIQPSYGEAKFSFDGLGSETSDWEYGTGIGANYQFDSNTSVEALYEYYDGTDVVSIGYRYRF